MNENEAHLKRFAAELVRATDHYFDVKLLLDTADSPEQESALRDDLDVLQGDIESAANKLRAALLVAGVRT